MAYLKNCAEDRRLRSASMLNLNVFSVEQAGPNKPFHSFENLIYPLDFASRTIALYPVTGYVYQSL